MTLRGFEHVLADLAESALVVAGGPADGVALRITAFDLRVPCEMRLNRQGGIDASMPRGRIATGFDPPLGRIRAVFQERDS